MIYRNGRARHERRGLGLIVVVVLLGLISAVMAVVAYHGFASRQILDRRHGELQADWLARSGIEWACAELLSPSPASPPKALELLPRSELRIDIRPEAGSPDMFRVVSEGRFPTDIPHPSMRRLEARLRKTAGKVEILSLQ